MDATTTAEPVNGEIVQYQPAAAEEYRPRILMAAGDAREIDQALRDMMKAVLHENVDYGVIPGTGSKPSLLKPGAEKLLQWFGFGHSMERIEIEHSAPGERLGVTYRCSVTKAMPDGRVIIVATCEGYAGYDEDRFFALAADARAKAERKERGNAERYKREPVPAKWEYITEDYKAPWNSVIKMAQKRALVGAALQATSGSTLFTQDIEDTAEPAVAQAASVASAASEVIAGLPKDARRGVDKWRREQGWPAVSEWDTAHWCAALVQAGRIAAEREFAAAGVEVVKPGDDAWATPEGGGDWVSGAIEQAAGLTSRDAGRVLWQQAVAKEQAGEITKEQKNEVFGLITARMEDLEQAVEGTIAPPDGDPWQAKVEEITNAEDAEKAIAELDQAHADGHIDNRRHKALRAAMSAKGASKRGAAA
jgi:hypothetical protein